MQNCFCLPDSSVPSSFFQHVLEIALLSYNYTILLLETYIIWNWHKFFPPIGRSWRKKKKLASKKWPKKKTELLKGKLEKMVYLLWTFTAQFQSDYTSIDSSSSLLHPLFVSELSTSLPLLDIAKPPVSQNPNHADNPNHSWALCTFFSSNWEQ
jgi:hypothetical protein